MTYPLLVVKVYESASRNYTVNGPKSQLVWISIEFSKYCFAQCFPTSAPRALIEMS